MLLYTTSSRSLQLHLGSASAFPSHFEKASAFPSIHFTTIIINFVNYRKQQMHLYFHWIPGLVASIWNSEISGSELTAHLPQSSQKASGLRNASGIPKELTTASAWGLSSLHSFKTSFRTLATLSRDKYPYLKKDADSSMLTITYRDLSKSSTSWKMKGYISNMLRWIWNIVLLSNEKDHRKDWFIRQ